MTEDRSKSENNNNTNSEEPQPPPLTENKQYNRFRDYRPQRHPQNKNVWGGSKSDMKF